MAGLDYNKSNNKSNNKNGGYNRGNHSFSSNKNYKGNSKGNDKKVNINFINPYNFVPLGKNVTKFHDSKDEKKLSGVIKFSLMTKTPLFIPNTSNDHAIKGIVCKKNNKYHKSYEFFSYEDLSELKKNKEKSELKAPIIPGSEIRGLIRSNYEMFTNSCLSSVDSKMKISRRTSNPFNAGLIKKTANGFELYKAEKATLKKEIVKKAVDKYIDGQKLYADIKEVNYHIVQSISQIRNGRLKEVYMLKGAPLAMSKEGYQVFYIGEKTPIKELSNLDEIYQELNGNSKARDYKEALKKFELGNDEEYFPVYYKSRRTSNPFDAGLIKKTTNGFELYKAEKATLKKEIVKNDVDKYIDGQKLYADIKEVNYHIVQSISQERKGELKEVLKEVYMLKGAPLAMRKKGYQVFYIGEETLIKKLSNLDAIKDTIKIYQDLNGKSKYKEYKEELKKFELGNDENYFPVYYKIIDDEKDGIMLSPACLTREIYNNGIEDVIGNYKPCSDKNNLCKACNLFGTLNNTLTVTSKVRMTDMNVDMDNVSKTEDLYEEPCTLKVLASPHLSSVEFYLKKPNNATFWTYDYYKEGKEIKIEAATINGRKFYWHNLNGEYIDINGESNLNISVRPVKKNIVFKGKIFFEDITEDELNSLIYIINAGDDQNIEVKSHGYKLGTGKPIGLGSVAMKVDEVKIHSVELDVTTEDLINREENFISRIPKIEEEIIKQLEMVTSFQNKDMDNIKMDYPRLEDANEIFKWFAQNHSGNKDVMQAYMKPLTPKLVMVDNNK